MKALTILQPWAHLIIHGDKRIENRTWPTHYRGPLAIHVGKSKARLGDYQGKLPGPSLAFGVLLGTVDLIDCLPISQAKGQPFAEGPWCWVLSNPRPLTRPIPCLGALSLWTLPDKVLRQMK